jgi:hypothetical protein
MASGTTTEVHDPVVFLGGTGSFADIGRVGIPLVSSRKLAGVPLVKGLVFGSSSSRNG